MIVYNNFKIGCYYCYECISGGTLIKIVTETPWDHRLHEIKKNNVTSLHDSKGNRIYRFYQNDEAYKYLNRYKL